MKKVFGIILICILANSCSREKIHHKVRFYGHVEDLYTHYPVRDAHISIETHYHAHSGPSVDSDLDNLAVTDANGNFDFTTKNIIKDKYSDERKLFFSGPAVDFMYGSGYWPINDIDDRENQLDVKLHTLARIGFRFINMNPFDVNDRVDSIYIDRAWGHQKFVEGDPVLIGNDVDSTIWTTYYGYQESYLYFTVTRNGIPQQYSRWIYVSQPFEGGMIYRDILY